MPTHQKGIKKCNINANEDQIFFYLIFGIFGSLFASTWFVFANQILFPISKSNTLVWANREIFQV
jgi:phosphate/sulfate permease